MVILLEQLMQWFNAYALVFTRIAAFLMILPIVGSRLVPSRIRLLIALTLCILVGTSVDMGQSVNVVSFKGVLLIVKEILIGLMFGFCLQLLFHIFVVAGQMIAMQNGLGFATLIDPTNGTNVTSISSFYTICVNLLFFSLNGHLAIIQFLVDSFKVWSVFSLSLPFDFLYQLTLMGQWMFTNALLIAMPAVVSLLIVNLCFGVVSRVAPQMNIISVGFPFTMLMGLIITWLTLGVVLPRFEVANAEVFQLLNEALY